MEAPRAATVDSSDALETGEAVMKKIVVLVGLAAAAYGAIRLFRGKEEEYNFDDFSTAQPQV